MAGDPSNATLWPDADVYVGATDATNPATVDDPFGASWDLVGLLDGDAGFTESREEEKKDIYAWGGILVRTSRKNFKLTKSFTALEDNDTTRAVIWPGSTGSNLVIPRPIRKKIAFQTVEGATVRRLISAYEVEVELGGDINDTEADITRYELIATIFPTAAGVLFVEQKTGASSS